MEKYTNLQIWLHWIIFVLIIFQYVLHEPIAGAFELRLQGKEFDQSALIPLHIAFGVLIFFLVATRLWVRKTQGVPAYPKEDAVLMKFASKSVHWSFYGILILLPITGMAAWFQLSEGAGKAHEALRAILILLIFLHVCASLFHYIAFKSNLFKRMWW